MESKPTNREWVKNAAIILLAVLLVLTFFSNTWRNHSLPEVATQNVTSGPIVAKVRGTGTVAANGSYQVKAEQTREIRAVMVRAGQRVETGDVLFVLGAGDSEELEAAQEALRQLQLSYQRAALGGTMPDYRADERKIEAAEAAMDEAEAAYRALEREQTESSDELKALQKQLDEAVIARDAYQEAYDKLVEETSQSLTEKETVRLDAERAVIELLGSENVTAEELADPASKVRGLEADPETDPAVLAAWQKLDTADQDAKAARAALDAISTQQLDAAQRRVDELQEQVSRNINSPAYQAAKSAYEKAEEEYLELLEALDQKKDADARSAALLGIDLSDINAQIEKQKQKIEELSGGEENQILSKVSGTVQSVEFTAGSKAQKDEVLCSIEVPDQGYTLSFSVTNEQASRLKPGDTATVSNYYWGSQILATLSTIRTDPQNPQTNKLLTFDLDGDVTAGSQLTISVGQKSANYDVILPNSAIRSDSNGSFVLKIEAKNSPLGNRYIARRVSVEVLASDDENSAVTGDLGWGDYVITTSNAPVKNGDMVRLAD